MLLWQTYRESEVAYDESAFSSFVIINHASRLITCYVEMTPNQSVILGNA